MIRRLWKEPMGQFALLAIPTLFLLVLADFLLPELGVSKGTQEVVENLLVGLVVLELIWIYFTRAR